MSPFRALLALAEAHRGTGAFLASGILRGSLDIPGNAGWQVPFALQWIWPIPLIIVAWMAPESE